MLGSDARVFTASDGPILTLIISGAYSLPYAQVTNALRNMLMDTCVPVSFRNRPLMWAENDELENPWPFLFCKEGITRFSITAHILNHQPVFQIGRAHV